MKSGNNELLRLFRQFNAPCPDGSGYAVGYYMEVALLIRKHGKAGDKFLMQKLKAKQIGRARAALFALGTGDLDDQRTAVLLKHLKDPRAMMAAEAIDGLRRQGCRSWLEQVLRLRTRKNPYVVGAVLRFVSAFDRRRAMPLLMDALRHPSYVVRENGCDELDALGATGAVPQLRQLLKDRNKDVRQAAKAALKNLERAAKRNSATP
jgi:hypothetical protein